MLSVYFFNKNKGSRLKEFTQNILKIIFLFNIKRLNSFKTINFIKKITYYYKLN